MKDLSPQSLVIRVTRTCSRQMGTMSTATSTYRYTPLDPSDRQIRLIELQPGQDDQPVLCRILITSLNDPTPYEALSYTWGDLRDLTEISIDDCSFDVGTNLARILQGLRDPSACRILWIDAVCINQQDIQEKGHQVSQMVHIYGHAQRTIVWLGGHRNSPNRTQGAEAIKELSRLGQLIRKHRLIEIYHYVARDETPPWLVDRPTTMILVVGLLLDIGNRLLDPSAWPMIKFLSKQKWWRRAWVLQEVVVANEVRVVFGRVVCDWSDVSAPFVLLQTASDDLLNFPALSAIFANRDSPGIPDSTAQVTLPTLDYQVVNTDAMRCRRVSGEPLKLLDLLYMQRRSLCQFPVDRIYSLVGMLPVEERAALRPDYTLPDWRVFQHVARYLAESTGRLDFLCMVRRLRPDRRRQVF